MIAPDETAVTLGKYEGAGNDFLVVVDLAGRFALERDLVRSLCDRHRGIGADGMIRVGPPRHGAPISMQLRNADGAEAEMSGNGIRCLAQAAVAAGLVTPPRFAVATMAGLKTVDYQDGTRPGTGWARVDMGLVALGDDQPQELSERRARRVDVGNPHLVLFGPDPAGVDVTLLGPKIESVHPGGMNVEFVALSGRPDELTLRVWERGVGETLACGTGSCAAAAAVRSWGFVGNSVRVHNPGGALDVTLGATDDEPVLLAGPVRKIADIVVQPDWLALRV